MKKTATILLSLLMAFVVAGCGGGGGSGQGDGGDGGEQITIGFSQHRVAGSDWYKHLLAGAREQAEKQGASIIVADAGGDAVQQNSDLQNFINRGVDGIVVNALDPRGLGGSFNTLEEQDIPFVAVNSRLTDEYQEMAYCFVAEDQVEAARKAGRTLAENVAQRYDSGDAVKLAVIGGYSGEITTELRQEGFLKGYNGYFEDNPGPETQILPTRYGEWLPDRARQPIQQVATANPDLAALFSMSDVMLPGIEQGLQEAGVLSDVVIVSYDGAMSVIEQMKNNPDGPVQGTVANTPYLQGAASVQMAINAVKGESVESNCPDGTYHTPSPLMTAENAEQFYNPDLGPYYYPEEEVQKLGSKLATGGTTE